MRSILVIINLIFWILISAVISCNSDKVGIVKYPAIPGLETSDLYEVHVNNRSIWVEKLISDMDLAKLPEWFTREPYTKAQQEIHIANFSCQSQILVTLKVREHINSVNIRPKERDIKYITEGNIIRFSLPGPDKLYIEINKLPPLCLFGNPFEDFKPDSTSSGVKYFGPGIHETGMITLEDDDTLYIAGGAIVYGGIRVKGASNVRVMGRGILDGGFKHRSMVVLEDGNDILFDGIMIRNGRGWTNTVIHCRKVKYKNIKVISFGPSGDGINPVGSREMEISNCFLRCTDDCIAIKSPDSTYVVNNITIEDNTMIGYAFSDGVTIGFETNGPVVEDIVVRNCDILLSRGGSRVDGHSAFSIICDGPARIRNILYENIRIDDDVLKLFELNITDGTAYGINPPGHIQDVHLKDIKWASRRPIILKGFDETHRIQNVIFEDCTIGNVLLDKTWTDIFTVNEFVDNIQYVVNN